MSVNSITTPRRSEQYKSDDTLKNMVSKLCDLAHKVQAAKECVQSTETAAALNEAHAQLFHECGNAHSRLFEAGGVEAYRQSSAKFATCTSQLMAINKTAKPSNYLALKDLDAATAEFESTVAELRTYLDKSPTHETLIQKLDDYIEKGDDSSFTSLVECLESLTTSSTSSSNPASLIDAGELFQASSVPSDPDVRIKLAGVLTTGII